MTGRAIYAKIPYLTSKVWDFGVYGGADSYFPLSIFLISLSLLSASTGVRLLMSSPRGSLQQPICQDRERRLRLSARGVWLREGR